MNYKQRITREFNDPNQFLDGIEDLLLGLSRYPYILNSSVTTSKGKFYIDDTRHRYLQLVEEDYAQFYIYKFIIYNNNNIQIKQLVIDDETAYDYDMSLENLRIYIKNRFEDHIIHQWALLHSRGLISNMVNEMVDNINKAIEDGRIRGDYK